MLRHLRGAAHLRFTAACATILFALAVLPARAAGHDEGANAIWAMLRQSLFASRSIAVDATPILTLEAPARAEDATVVPIAIRAQAPQTAQRYVDKVYLIIDHNPSPLAAVFRFAPESGRADVETRMRIEDYTTVRAIAEMNDGSLHMVTRYVKASGGCSAAADQDLAAALAGVGRMKFRVVGPVRRGHPALVQLMISHPNSSGLAMNQVTRLYAPPYFVRSVAVTYRGKPVMSADVDFSISENPNFRFYFVPQGDGELQATVVDSHGLVFRGRAEVDTQQVAGR
jgi:sulfur-oxidizing protein SoxY